MPASRIVFALNDLIEEIGRLTPDADDLSGALVLPPEAYQAVRAEVNSHAGRQQMEIQHHRLGGRAFKFKGFDVVSGG